MKVDRDTVQAWVDGEEECIEIITDLINGDYTVVAMRQDIEEFGERDAIIESIGEPISITVPSTVADTTVSISLEDLVDRDMTLLKLESILEEEIQVDESEITDGTNDIIRGRVELATELLALL